MQSTPQTVPNHSASTTPNQRIIYLDNNATTRVAPEVLESMIPFLSEIYFNPSSMYQPATIAAEALRAARRTVARSLHAPYTDEILFTSCATESNNTAIMGAVRANPNRKHIITSAVEHPAILEVVKELERTGYEITYLPVDEKGQINKKELIHALRKDTLIVSLIHGNNETGVVSAIEELSYIVKETDATILFHTDATQTVGKIPIYLNESFKYVDLLSFSGHKLHAPKGVGALYVRRGTRIRPFLMGGHQEKSRRAGTENIAYIVGLAKAMEMANGRMEEESKTFEAWRDHLEKAVLAQIPKVRINGYGSQRLPNTTNLSFEYIEGEAILQLLNEHGICASSGSACTSGSLEPSHVLLAMKVPFTSAHGSIRFSLSHYTTLEEIDYLIRVLPDIIHRIRNISPYWKTEYGLVNG